MPTLTRDHALMAMAIMETAGLKRPAIVSTPERMDAAADLWVDMFPTMPPATFAAAVKAHMLDPERGRFWPTPADIAQAAERIACAGLPSAARVFADLVPTRGSFGSWRKDAGIASLLAKGYPEGKLLAGIEALGGWDPIGNVPDPRYGGSEAGRAACERIFAAAYNAAPVTSTALTVAP